MSTQTSKASLEKFNSALLKINKCNFVDRGNLEQALHFITEVAAETMGVARVSVWTYNDDRSAIICRNLFELDKNLHSSGLELYRKDFPRYFAFLKEERSLAAHDARIDPATSEFAEVYLKPLGIVSMLDAPIRINGELMGVVCQEQIGRLRHWSIEEETFAGAIADYVGRAFESFQRNEALSELKIRQLQITQSAKMAALGEMAGGIAHEINNPLQVLVTAAENLMELSDSKEVDKAYLKKMSQMVMKTAMRIEKTVKGLRFFARENSKDGKDMVDLKNIIEDTLSFCRERMITHGVQLEVNIPDEAMVIYSNPVGISQVVLNLLNNAYDAVVESEGPWIRVSAERTPGGQVLVMVTDSGHGLPPEIKDRIMEPFFTTKAFGKGTGLGLSVSKGIIESHQGRLFLDDNCPNTRFVIELPGDLPETAAA
jgi:signal transduction histidine kinase